MAKLHLAQEILNIIYPVGSVYISTNATNPTNLFGGTWVQLKGGFLYGSMVTNGQNAYSTGNIGSGTNTNNFTLQNKHMPGRVVVRTEGKARFSCY